MTANEAAIKLARQKNISYEAAYKRVTGRAIETAVKLSAEERDKPVKPEGKPTESAPPEGPRHFAVMSHTDYEGSELHGVHPTLEAAQAHLKELRASKYGAPGDYQNIHEYSGKNKIKEHEVLTERGGRSPKEDEEEERWEKWKAANPPKKPE